MTKKSPWTAAAERIQDPAYREAERDRLSKAVGVEGQQTALEQEIKREMAAALGRADAKVQAALAALEEAGREVDLCMGDRSEAIAKFNALRAAALAARLDLVIQREAIGIRRNDRIEHNYPIPPARKA